MTPAEKRTGMTAAEQSQNTAAPVPTGAESHELSTEEDSLEADDGYSDSGFGTDSS